MNSSITYDKTSHWFSGHFPGRPILPGVAQLKAVLDCIIATEKEQLTFSGLSRVKFKRIVTPDEQLDIHITRGNEKHQYMFTITSDDEDVCSGRILFTQRSS
ncbi:MAG TPA: hypothetical protein VJ969_10130 [Desulfopila sp.]|nr:hypothetical protein [Desulfopila sp.]